MENSKNKTYITEKILHGFAANTIPVYWGSDYINEYFNEERYINVKSFNDNDMNEAVDKILKLVNDNDKYLEIINKPIYKNNKNPFKIDDISNKIQRLLSITPREQQKIFMTFGGMAAGAKTENHPTASNPGKPASETVGMSGSNAVLLTLVTAKGFSL